MNRHSAQKNARGRIMGISRSQAKGGRDDRRLSLYWHFPSRNLRLSQATFRGGDGSSSPVGLECLLSGFNILPHAARNTRTCRAFQHPDNPRDQPKTAPLSSRLSCYTLCRFRELPSSIRQEKLLIKWVSTWGKRAAQPAAKGGDGPRDKGRTQRHACSRLARPGFLTVSADP